MIVKQLKCHDIKKQKPCALAINYWCERGDLNPYGFATTRT